jgi:hypothetical protein
VDFPGLKVVFQSRQAKGLFTWIFNAFSCAKGLITWIFNAFSCTKSLFTWIFQGGQLACIFPAACLQLEVTSPSFFLFLNHP